MNDLISETKCYATYSVEDNKIRIYAETAFTETERKHLKSEGFRFAPKQVLWVAPAWSPYLQDCVEKFTGQPLQPEQVTRRKRAQSKSDAYHSAAVKAAIKSDEACGSAVEMLKVVPYGQPIQVNHHSTRAHRNLLERSDNAMRRSVAERDKSQHYATISDDPLYHVDHMESERTRKNRVKKLEALLRKNLKVRKASDMNPVQAMLARCGEVILTGEVTTDILKVTSLSKTVDWSFDWDKPQYQFDDNMGSGAEVHIAIYHEVCTPGQGLDRLTRCCTALLKRDEYRVRWANHYEMRISYENKMIEAM